MRGGCWASNLRVAKNSILLHNLNGSRTMFDVVFGKFLVRETRFLVDQESNLDYLFVSWRHKDSDVGCED